MTVGRSPLISHHNVEDTTVSTTAPTDGPAVIPHRHLIRRWGSAALVREYMRRVRQGYRVEDVARIEMVARPLTEIDECRFGPRRAPKSGECAGCTRPLTSGRDRYCAPCESIERAMARIGPAPTRDDILNRARCAALLAAECVSDLATVGRNGMLGAPAAMRVESTGTRVDKHTVSTLITMGDTWADRYAKLDPAPHRAAIVEAGYGDDTAHGQAIRLVEAAISTIRRAGLHAGPQLPTVPSDLIDRVRAEYLAAIAPAAKTPAADVIVSHGGQHYSIGRCEPILVTENEDNILTAFLENPMRMQTAELEKRAGKFNVADVIHKLASKYNGQFTPAISPSGKAKLGYFVRVSAS